MATIGNESNANAMHEATISEGDEVDSLLEFRQLELALLIMKKYFPLFYTIVGSIGNTISLCITSMPKNRSISMCIYMSALSVMDTLVLLTVLVYTLLFKFSIAEYMEESLRYPVHT